MVSCDTMALIASDADLNLMLMQRADEKTAESWLFGVAVVLQRVARANECGIDYVSEMARLELFKSMTQNAVQLACNCASKKIG